MNSIILLQRPVEPTGQWNTSVQAVNAIEDMAMRQWITDNAPPTATFQGWGLRVSRALRLGL